MGGDDGEVNCVFLQKRRSHLSVIGLYYERIEEYDGTEDLVQNVEIKLKN